MPIDGVEMKIVDPASGAELAAGEKGEIVVRGHNVMLGYWGRPEDTALAVRDGWFHTGDIGRRDVDGYFFIEDRLSDLIIMGGVNVYPAEVENILHSHPAVAEAAVYGVKEALLGEQVYANVVLRQEAAAASEDDILRYCRKRLAEVKTPSVMRFVQSIPKSPTGKILKRVLRQEAAEQARNRARRRVTEDEVKRWIANWLASHLETPPSPNSANVSFADLRHELLRIVRFTQDLNRWLGSSLELTAPWSHPTAAAMAQHLANWREAQAESENPGNSEDIAEALVLTELDKLNR